MENTLLALFAAALSGVVGVAQLRMFRRTRRTWRLFFASAAFANSGALLVILVLLLNGFFS